MTAEQAVGLVRPGDRVWVGSACGTPRALLSALNALPVPLPGVRLVHFLADGVTVGSELRPLARSELVDYVPVSLSEVPSLIARGQHRVDVALVQVAPPDEHGMCSLGVTVDVTLAAALRARTVIAEVNPAMPRTGPATTIPVERISALVEVPGPVAEYHHQPVG